MRKRLEQLEQLAQAAHRLMTRHWRRALAIRNYLRLSEEAFHLLLAGVVGVIGGLVNLLFYFATESVKNFFTRRLGSPVEVAEMLGDWQRVILPTLGGLAAGLVLYFGLRLVGRQGPSNMLEVVVAGDGRLPFRSSIVRFLSSLLSIGTGASIGREGGITQLSATLASKLGQLRKWPPYRLRLLVGCGAASGIASAYNAPISGAVFAALIVLGNFSMGLFAPLVFSSVIATMVSRSFFGIDPWYSVPPFQFTSVSQLPWFVFLGLLCGIAGAFFLKLLNLSEDLFRRSRLPLFLQMALGGLIVGLIALRYPQVWGNGYIVTNRILHGEFSRETAGLLFLGGLFLAKLAATSATVGSGAVGGVFTPTLFLGAGLGAAFGLLLEQAGFAKDLPNAAFAVVGMGSMLAATTRSPLLAMILIFEISLDYSLMPPLMLGCVMAILAAKRLHPESIYTEPLRRRGLELEPETAAAGAATERTVGDLMRAPVPPVRETAALGEITNRFLTGANNFLPVVNAKQQLVGVVALQDLKEYLGTGTGSGDGMPGIIAYDLMRPPPGCVTPGQRLLDALPVVLSSELRNIPVVNSPAENRLVGALSRAEVLNVFGEAISGSVRIG